MSYRLGVDVGGTFTDLLVVDEKSGRTFRDKVPSTPDDPSRAVVAGARQVCEANGISAADIDLFLHGTTVATNAVLEGKVARVGLVVTEGYRHILQIARSLVPGGLAAWIIWPKPEPLAPLEATVEAPGRIGADGSIVRPLDEAKLRANLEVLRGEKVEAITVCLMNSYVNDAHERRVAEIIGEMFPDLPVSVSADILPEMQEYERALTTVANSAVRPIVSRYVGNLERELKSWGTPAKLNLLRSDGGLMSADKSRSAPVNLLMSGPAGGVAGALWVAKNSGFPNVLTLDMGGTSTDVALIEGGQPRLRRETSVGHLTVRASSLDVKTVGAGGGSIAAVPALTGALRVGPQSAGAFPGPAAYGKGGTEPTVTDANVVLGYLPENLLGGSFRLDREAAKTAVKKVADALNIGIFEAAAGIIAIVNENMFGALRLVSVAQGYDPRDFALMPFGGAGPLHGNAMGQLMGSWPVLVPPSPGVLCAYGDATTRLRVDAQRSFNRLATDTTDAEVGAVIDTVIAQVSGELASEGVAPADMELRVEIDIRYAGQAFEVPLYSPQGSTICGPAGALRCRASAAVHLQSSVPHELVNIRVVALGKAGQCVSAGNRAGGRQPGCCQAARPQPVHGRARDGRHFMIAPSCGRATR
jgi:N-methylhydantoinase A